MNNLKINHLAVLVSVVWMFVLGFLWYGPIFGEPWMEMSGLTLEGIEADPPGAGVWISNLFSSIVPIYVLAWIFVRMNVNSLVSGLTSGLIISAAFSLLPVITGGLFAKDPYALAWIEGGFQVAGWTVAGAILGAWTKTK